METIFDMVNKSYEEKEKIYLDSFNKLNLEYDGIKKTIRHYTSEGLVTNYLNKLGEALNNQNADNIEYCLKGILDWYNTNIDDLAESNGLVDFNLHKRNLELIENFYKTMASTPSNCKVFEKELSKETSSESNSNVISTVDTPNIFISHCSADKKYGHALRNFIMGLGIEKGNLIYTSHPLHKIPSGKNIYNYLRSRINNQTFMLFLFSKNYLDSTACLNEMGAAWLAQTEYLNFYVPNFDFGNNKYLNCAIDKNQMGIKLENNDILRISMIEFKDRLVELFKINPDEATVSNLIDNFIQEIQ